MKLAIVGSEGVIGGALQNYIRETSRHTVVGDDLLANRHDDFLGCEGVFICLPAPTLPSRRQDLSVVEGALLKYGSLQCPFFMRTTVLPGTCDRLSAKTNKQVVALPEFLTQKLRHEDIKKHNIISGTQGKSKAYELLTLIFPEKKIYQMTNTEAELSKYTHNCLGMWKVVYHNAIKTLCLRLKADYKQVLKSYEITDFFTRHHTHVPGWDDKWGAGGKCLPKDMSALISVLQDNMVPARSWKGIESENQIYRSEELFHLPPNVPLEKRTQE